MSVFVTVSVLGVIRTPPVHNFSLHETFSNPSDHLRVSRHRQRRPLANNAMAIKYLVLFTQNKNFRKNSRRDQSSKSNIISVQYRTSRSKRLLFSDWSLFLEGAEEVAECLTTRVTYSVHTHAPASLEEVTVDLHGTNAWCDVPDVGESDAGEVAAPTRGDRDTTECRQDDVAQRFPHAETFVGVFPDTVNAVSVVRFTNRLLK